LQLEGRRRAPVVLALKLRDPRYINLQIQQFRKANFGNRWAFLGVFGQSRTAHAQKLLVSSFRSKCWHRRWVDLWPIDLERL